MTSYVSIGGRWMVLFSLLYGCSQLLEARECTLSVARVVSVQGRVEFMRAYSSNWMIVRQDDHFCAGDRLRVLANSRAGLILSNESLLRLAENSSVLFNAPNDSGNTLLDLLYGIGHFISRIRKSFQVNTPYLNALVQGTEFTVESHAKGDRVTVLEGSVLARNEQGEVVVKAGWQVDSQPGKAPSTRGLVNPRDAVQWALYYPLVLIAPADHSSEAVRRSVEAYRRSDLSAAFSALAVEPGVDDDAALLVYRASLHLQVGGIEAARRDLQGALSLRPEQVDALALMSVIATVHSEYQAAIDLARRAVRADAQSASAYLALSYAYQARFQLNDAREAARQATLVAPESSLAWARLAQLELMFRDLEASTVAANRAVGIDPGQSQSQATLGFARLISFDLKGARESFEQAASLEQSAPLPRLGLGLVQIREGDLAGGRRQLEIAANLDPGSAVIRSYLGKAYYEERRYTLAATQFALAKGFDKLDPTAWFYDAIRKQAENRPIEALKDIQTSIELNGNRAVYRSRLLLDQDEAARGASQGRIYQDLEFDQLAQTEANKSLQTSAQNHSAHRLLADSYSGRPRYEKARLSELLQSQLLQPLNTTPIQPQLAVSNLGILDGAGPSAGGFSEYTPLFTRNGLEFQTNAIGGNSSTWGDDLILSGLKDKMSFSVGQFHYETDGWRENSDLEQDIYDAFLQYALSASTSIQFEYRHQDAESGDLGLQFNAEEASLTERNDLERRFGRVGIHHQFISGSDLIVSAIYQDMQKKQTETSTFSLPVTETPYGFLPATREINISTAQDSILSSLEMQYIQSLGRHTLTFGAGYYEEDYTVTNRVFAVDRYTNPVTFDIEEQLISDSSQPVEQDPNFKDIYIYTLFALPAQINMTLGAAFEDYEDVSIKTQHLGPKFGLSWDVWRDLRIRAAYLEKLSRPIHFERTLEQTQVVGFNQQFDDFQGSEIEQLGVGIDAKPWSGLHIGVEANRRDIREPFFSTQTEDTMYESRDEKLVRGYLYWTATDRLGARIGRQYEALKMEKSQPKALTSRQTSVGFSYYWPSGWFLDVEGDRINQEITRNSELESVTEQADFWNVDLVMGYRFPMHYGKLEFIAKNILDEEFSYYDMSIHTAENLMPQFQPKRQLFARVTLNF